LAVPYQGLCPSDGLAHGADYKKTLEGVGEPKTFLERSGRKILQPVFFEAGNRSIARYALGPDYHAAIKEKLLKIIEGVKPAFPRIEGRIFVDTSPVLEKELGRLAGLGFRGKNTLLINPKLGSYFVLGGVAFNLELTPGIPPGNGFAGPCHSKALAKEDGCGDCDLCVKACPGGALREGRLSASKCVSYLTTQAKEEIPSGLVSNSGGFAYGCDICQEVCPYNADRL
jgi:epoxyqueuosine reductase